ncbi:MAG: PH domain-containing protein [Bacteroidaceae bacterium]|nr:PH domain-containing protein [Bacteroidaceae bacterium]
MFSTRTYHARVQVGNWVLIAILSALTIYLIWDGNGLLIAGSLLLLLLIIERTIHTEYQLSEESLTVNNGKLSKRQVVPMDSIKRIERIRRIRIGKNALITYLLIVYGEDRTVAVMPKEEEAFIKQIMDIKKYGTEQ